MDNSLQGELCATRATTEWRKHRAGLYQPWLARHWAGELVWGHTDVSGHNTGGSCTVTPSTPPFSTTTHIVTVIINTDDKLINNKHLQ